MSALPATYGAPLRIYAGDDFYQKFDFRNAGDQSPMNLSGWTFRAQWRATPNAETAVNFGIDSTDKATGTIVLTLTAAQTREIGQDGVWDLQGTETSGGRIRTWLRGTVTWREDVTRDA